jgi:hypothetical protein
LIASRPAAEATRQEHRRILHGILACSVAPARILAHIGAMPLVIVASLSACSRCHINRTSLLGKRTRNRGARCARPGASPFYCIRRISNVRAFSSLKGAELAMQAHCSRSTILDLQTSAGHLPPIFPSNSATRFSSSEMRCGVPCNCFHISTRSRATRLPATASRTFHGLRLTEIVGTRPAVSAWRAAGAC